MTDRTIQVTTLLAQADLLLVLRDLIADADRATRAVSTLDEASLQELLTHAAIPANQALLQRWADARPRQCERIVADHSLLFEGAERCPLNQTAYIRRDKGAVLADVCGFYRAFGFEPSRGNGERPDHLASELEFVALLLVLLARAAEAGDEENVRITRDAVCAFVRDHLGEWMPAATTHLADIGAGTAYEAIAELMDAIWIGLCSLHGWPTAPSMGAPQEHGDEQTPYECAMIPSPVELTIDGMRPES